jgi:serine/threonine protein kinase
MGESLNQVMAKAAVNGGVPLFNRREPDRPSLQGAVCRAQSARRTRRAGRARAPRHLAAEFARDVFLGTAKIVDFGIAKATSKSSGFTEVGEVKGKFAYMAPEQVRALAVDNRTDLFALGILLYQITTASIRSRGESRGDGAKHLQ